MNTQRKIGVNIFLIVMDPFMSLPGVRFYCFDLSVLIMDEFGDLYAS